MEHTSAAIPAAARRSRSVQWIDGDWRATKSDHALPVVDPATGLTLAEVPAGGRADVDAAVAAAARAFPAWSRTPLEERLRYLDRLAELLDEHADTVAGVLTAETGMPVTLARHAQVSFGVGALRSCVEAAREHAWEQRIGNSLVRSEAAGATGCITPWNAPVALNLQKIPAALAAGCTVVLKPSELAPLSSYLLAELIARTDLPPGVFNLVCGTGPQAGEALAAHPEIAVVSLTGSIRAGRRVSELAAPRAARVNLELGGKSASIVLPGADLRAAVTATVEQANFNTGQVCFAWSRLLVPAHRYDEAVAIAAETAGALRVGDPWEPATQIGPLIHHDSVERVRGILDDAIAGGATLVKGGEVPAGAGGGSYLTPAVLADLPPRARAVVEEVFGPVVVVLPYRDEDDAVRIADDTEYGLSGAVWSEDVEHAVAVAARLRTGRVDVNGAPFNMRAPFGGYKSSGNGRELGSWGLASFCETKAIQLPPAGEGEAGLKLSSTAG
ncbi:aldehyde dehydrogenase family protein [Streptomyces sp. NPDC090057]|uniref:aldehyde dehydrogenase family protein n=1 Tax=Streptomyces sp. NPDC090057 TaxID=3365935 RepID=UPI003825DB39